MIPETFICHRISAAVWAVVQPDSKTALFQSYFIQLNKQGSEKGKELLIIIPKVDKDLLSLGGQVFILKAIPDQYCLVGIFSGTNVLNFVLWFIQIIGMFFEKVYVIS